MINKIWKSTLLFVSLVLSGCNNTVSTSFDTTSSSIDDSSTITSISEPASSYEKDEQGFYILEDDYFSYTEDINDTKQKNQVYIPELVENQPLYSQFRMYIGNQNVPIYNVKTNYSHSWAGDAPNRMNNAVTTIGLNGKAIIKVQTSFNILNDVQIRPLDRKVNYQIDDSRNVLIFEIKSTGQYTIEFRNERTLHLFVNSIEDMYNPFDNAIVFGPGIHNSSNDSRINSSGIINLYSNQNVYIAPNAFIYGSFRAYNASNIKIVGSGYVDGSTFKRNAYTGDVLVPFDFDYCSNITFNNLSCIDPAGWCFNIYFCKEVYFNNVKIISSRSNGDGISIQSCKNVYVDQCFVRTWDDSLVVKNYPEWSNKSSQGVTSNINFSNCVVWTDLAQSMEIGYETVGVNMSDIKFENITVLHNYHKAVFSIHNGNNANIKNVTFKNITVEDAKMGKGDGNICLVDLANVYSSTWSDQHAITSLGSIDNVDFIDIKIVSGITEPSISINGCIDPRVGYSKEPHYITNVTFTNFYLYYEFINSSYSNFNTSYSSNIVFETKDYINLGAILISDDVSGFGNNIEFLS